MSITVPVPGQLVEARRRQFVVLDVSESALQVDALRNPLAVRHHLVTLSSVEEDALGETLQVVWEVEPGARVRERANLPEPTGFDEPRVLDAFLDAVRWGAVSNADVKTLLSPFRSGITIEDYQLEPVVRALQMPRVHLLIADDVGLGKTIEAGLVAQELIFRHRVRSILVVCPAALQIHWRDQMRDKFGLEFRIVDSALMKDLRRRRGLHVNPWNHFPRLITSIDFLKRDRPLRLFREELPPPGQPVWPRRFDLLIVDESHNVAPQGSGNYAVDSQRTQAIRTIAPHFEHRLFLTATPHNGHRESFSALLELVDDQRFHRGFDPDPTQLRAVMVRRLKSEFKNWEGKQRFASRQIVPMEVVYPDEERRCHRLLDEYTALRRRSTLDTVERFATEFVFKILKKRLFSSPAAFAATLEKHERSMREAVRRPAASLRPTLPVLRRQEEDLDVEAADDEDRETSIVEAVDTATRVFRPPTDREQALLKELRTLADGLAARADAKARVLLQWLEQNLRPGGTWNDQRVILFTEYRATQNWLFGILAASGFTKGERVLTLYGGMDTDERERVKAAFQASPADAPVRILLATDAASEGIDLQNHCSRLIHFEIPWNPNRLEQRNGRVDRHGQRADVVQIHHFVSAGYQERMKACRGLAPGELDGDLEFLAQAVLKVETIREDLGKVGPVIASQVEDAMLGKRATLDTHEAEDRARGVRKMLAFERDLRKQLAEYARQFHETREELRLSPEHIRAVVEVGLQLAGKPPLREAEVPGLWPDPAGHRKACSCFHVPALGGSWALCLEGLAHPHTGVTRPIVFDNDLAAGRDDVVLAHLNHRLVQMCLHLLRAEVWAAGDGYGTKRMHRVAARVVDDPTVREPVILAHARLVVLGGDNHRLHEEVVTAGVRLHEGRAERLKVGEVERVVRAQRGDGVPQNMKERLAAHWPHVRDPLFTALEARRADRQESIQKALDARADKEVREIEAVLRELETAIRRELSEPEYTQLELWTPEEVQQLERNKSSLKARLAEIPAEIEREKANLRARYREPRAHLFPVAVTFLMPNNMEGGRG